MSYSPQSGMAGHSMFDNVFVNPDAYKAFLETGTWPDKTMLVLEIRAAGSNASINKSGPRTCDQEGDTKPGVCKGRSLREELEELTRRK
jgi:hypothetical protein